MLNLARTIHERITTMSDTNGEGMTQQGFARAEGKIYRGFPRREGKMGIFSEIAAASGGVVTMATWIEYIDTTHRRKRKAQRGSGDNWLRMLLKALSDGCADDTGSVGEEEEAINRDGEAPSGTSGTSGFGGKRRSKLNQAIKAKVEHDRVSRLKPLEGTDRNTHVPGDSGSEEEATGLQAQVEKLNRQLAAEKKKKSGVLCSENEALRHDPTKAKAYRDKMKQVVRGIANDKLLSREEAEFPAHPAADAWKSVRQKQNRADRFWEGLDDVTEMKARAAEQDEDAEGLPPTPEPATVKSYAPLLNLQVKKVVQNTKKVQHEPRSPIKRHGSSRSDGREELELGGRPNWSTLKSHTGKQRANDAVREQEAAAIAVAGRQRSPKRHHERVVSPHRMEVNLRADAVAEKLAAGKLEVAVLARELEEEAEPNSPDFHLKSKELKVAEMRLDAVQMEQLALDAEKELVNQEEEHAAGAGGREAASRIADLEAKLAFAESILNANKSQVEDEGLASAREVEMAVLQEKLSQTEHRSRQR